MARMHHRLRRLERLLLAPSDRSTLDIEAACARYAQEQSDQPAAAASAPGIVELREILLASPAPIAGALARLSPMDWAL